MSAKAKSKTKARSKTKATKAKAQAVFNRIVDDLGGVTQTARVTGRSPSQICQYRSRYGQFPAGLFFCLKEALTRSGHRCPRVAFRFDSKDKKANGSDG